MKKFFRVFLSSLFGKKYKLQTEYCLEDSKGRKFELWYSERRFFYFGYIKRFGQFSEALIVCKEIKDFEHCVRTGTYNLVEILDELEDKQAKEDGIYAD